MIEDLIDFPVSDDWLNHYHRKGLTPHYSTRMEQQEIERLRKQINDMQKDLKEIHELMMANLREVYKALKYIQKTQVNKRNDDKKPYETWKDRQHEHNVLDDL